jgi:general nucleoside transport system permease protein
VSSGALGRIASSPDDEPASVVAEPPGGSSAPGEPEAERLQAAPPARMRRAITLIVRSLVPVILALVAGGILLLALGRDPLKFYLAVWQGGVEFGAWQNSAILMTPLLLVAVGLIVVFRANIWNLGYDGQYLLGAALVAGLAPTLFKVLPPLLCYVILGLVAAFAGAVWTLVPALLKAKYQTNEIITTLMMSFIGVDVANILVKGPFQDPAVNIPQTRTIPYQDLLPNLGSTRVNAGVVVALLAAVGVHYALTRTSFGLRLHVLGANPRAARHVGLDVRRLVIASFLWSGALIGLAAAMDILGLWSYVRANWNPAYGDMVIPFVFLARLNALAVIPFIAFYAVLSTGGALATQQVGLPTDFLLVLVGLILLFMSIIEYVGRRRDLGSSYLTKGLAEGLRRPFLRKTTADQ